MKLCISLAYYIKLVKIHIFFGKTNLSSDSPYMFLDVRAKLYSDQIFNQPRFKGEGVILKMCTQAAQLN